MIVDLASRRRPRHPTREELDRRKLVGSTRLALPHNDGDPAHLVDPFNRAGDPWRR